MTRFRRPAARLRARRLVAALAGLSLVAGLSVAVAPVASAATAPVASRTSTGVTADALPTVQIDGVVWSQVVGGNVVYAGGSFATARPAGAAPGVNTVTRNNLLAYDITTGNLITSFAPSLNAQVKAVALSPDGSRLYVGGDFTNADGQPRYRIAAYSTATGALVSSFAPGVDYEVNAIAATNTTVYVGGGFSQANGVARARLAAFSAADGSLLGWAPSADNNEVQAMVLTPAGDKLIVGGSFTSINGSSSAYGLGALDPSSGALLPWAATSSVRDAGSYLDANGNGNGAAILSLSTDGKAIYGSGYVFGSTGNLEGAFSADPSSGALNWVEDCHGDTYGTFATNNLVYVVGHPHDCTNTGDFPQTNPWSYHRALAWTANAAGTNLTNAVGGYANWGGTPAPSMENWFPDLDPGSVTGEAQAAWSVSGNSKYVVLGGEFPSVNGVAQQGLVRFAVPSIAPDKQGPMLSGSLYQTSETALSGSSVQVSWPTNWDRDDQTLTYQLIRNGDDNHPIYTVTTNSQFWNRPTLSYTDTGLSPNTTYNYFVRVTDPDGNSVRGDYTTVTTTGAAASGTYPQQVQSSGASSYWRLDDAAGSTTGRDTIGRYPLTEQSGVTQGAAGAVAGDTAATFSGTSSGVAATSTAVTSPGTFSIETWFKTSTANGGKIVGFGDSSTGLAVQQYDRHIYMDNVGHLVFGVYNGNVATVASARSYNDNTWHYAVGTLSGAGLLLYVDGAQVAANTSVTSATNYVGYWRVGGDRTAGWPSAPTSNFFAGSIDDTAIYPTALSAATIQAHYAAATPASTAVPTASFTSSCPSTTCSFDGTKSTGTTGATIASYAWSFGDGSFGAGATPAHTYSAPGSYPVVLTVTDTAGRTSNKTATVSVAQAPPTAAFTSTCTALSCSFDASGSTAAGGATVSSYSWTFGDSSTGSGVTPTHTYTAAGTDTVTLTVTDSNGRTGTVSKTVTPTAPAKPTASFTASCTNLSCSFDASASSAVSGTTITSYSWTFGDNSSGTGVKPTHTYAAAGTDTVTLTVLDGNNQSATVTKTVTPTAAVAAPTATFTKSCSGLSCTFDASGSTAASGATLSSYAWTFGDGSSGSGVKPSHTFTAAGTYTVTLTVTDNAGRVGSTSAGVTVTTGTPPLVTDTFSRSASNGWGTADSGQGWDVWPPSAFSVSGGTGQISLPSAGSSSWAGLNASATTMNLTFDVGLSKAATGGGTIVALGARQTANGQYYVKVRFLGDGSVHLVISKSTQADGETIIREVAISGLTYTAGTLLHVRFQITGTGTTTLAGKVWAGGTEPASSQVTVTDNESVLQGAGTFTLQSFLASDATPLSVLFDNLTVTGS